MKTNIIVLLVLGIGIIGGTIALSHKNPIESNETIVACTEEALLCPDGTSVGRSGPQCAFAACPTTSSSLTGKLTQQRDGKFFLVIAAPANSIQEVSYALPLQLNVSATVGQIIGQQVTVHGSFVEGNTFHVDNLEELTGADNGGNTAEITVGETKFVNGVRITLNSIVGDSRCPVDVTCIQAGSVTARVILKSNTDTETVNLNSSGTTHNFDSFKISITNIKPSRIAAHAPGPKDYKVTFKVEENK